MHVTQTNSLLSSLRTCLVVDPAYTPRLQRAARFPARSGGSATPGRAPSTAAGQSAASIAPCPARPACTGSPGETLAPVAPPNKLHVQWQTPLKNNTVKTTPTMDSLLDDVLTKASPYFSVPCAQKQHAEHHRVSGVCEHPHALREAPLRQPALQSQDCMAIH